MLDVLEEMVMFMTPSVSTIQDLTLDLLDARFVSKKGYSGSAYTHQGWLTEDQSIVLLDDELDEGGSTDKRTRTYIWDVTDLTSPVLKNTYYHTTTSIDHNLYIRDGLAYMANYQAGLRLMDI